MSRSSMGTKVQGLKFQGMTFPQYGTIELGNERAAIWTKALFNIFPGLEILF